METASVHGAIESDNWDHTETSPRSAELIERLARRQVQQQHPRPCIDPPTRQIWGMQNPESCAVIRVGSSLPPTVSGVTGAVTEIGREISPDLPLSDPAWHHGAVAVRDSAELAFEIAFFRPDSGPAQRTASRNQLAASRASSPQRPTHVEQHHHEIDGIAREPEYAARENGGLYGHRRRWPRASFGSARTLRALRRVR